MTEVKFARNVYVDTKTSEIFSKCLICGRRLRIVELHIVRSMNHLDNKEHISIEWCDCRKAPTNKKPPKATL